MNKKIVTIISICLLLIIITIIIILKYRDENKCLTVFTMDEIADFDIKNKSHLWIDDDFYLNSCDDNYYNCSDFCTQTDAQKVFDECYYAPQTENPIRDIHNLDNDEDNIACELLK